MELTEVADRVEIRTLSDIYSVACDTLNWDLFRTAFTEDAVFNFSEVGGPYGGLEETIAWLNNGLSKWAAVHHNITTQYVEISGNTARSVTYFIDCQTMPDGSGGEDEMTLGGFYKDRLRRTADGWRICERHDLATWIAKPLPPRLTPPPAWYGTFDHHKAELLPQTEPGARLVRR